jgi:hypothetical protein
MIKIEKYDSIGVGYTPTFNEFELRVKENLKLLNGQKFDFYKYLFFDLKKGKIENVHSDTLSKSINDIRASIPLGQLAWFAQNGADAVKIINGKYVDTELKTIEIDEENIIIGENNEIYHESSNGKRVLAESYFQIGFTVATEYTKQSKNRPTYLILRKKINGEIIDAFYLDGKIILEEISKGDPDKDRKSVALKVFLEKGRKEKLICDYIGWENWKQQIKKTAKYIRRPEKIEEIKKNESRIRSFLRKEISEKKSKKEQCERIISRILLISRKHDSLLKKVEEKLIKYKEQIRILELKLKEEEKRKKVLSGRKTRIYNLINDVEKTKEIEEEKINKNNLLIFESETREKERIKKSKIIKNLTKQ